LDSTFMFCRDSVSKYRSTTLRNSLFVTAPAAASYSQHNGDWPNALYSGTCSEDTKSALKLPIWEKIDQELCVFEEVPLRKAFHSVLHKVAPIHSIEVCGGLEDQLHLILAPDGCIALCLGERAAGIHVIGNRIDSRLHLGVSEKKKLSCPLQ